MRPAIRSSRSSAPARRELVILEDEVRAISDETGIMTDDGSLRREGPGHRQAGAVDRLGRRRLVLAIGPVPMMQAVAETTREPHGIRTIVSLNSIMVDGTGMCGGCRRRQWAARQFACVDGPEFDAHQVDFDVLAQRNRMYRRIARAGDGAVRGSPRRGDPDGSANPAGSAKRNGPSPT